VVKRAIYCPVPAVSPEDKGIGAGGFGFSVGVQNENGSSRFTSQSAPHFQTGLDAEPAPKQESLADIVKRLAAMPADERGRSFGCDPESVERKRQRLAELNAKADRLSQFEEAERQRLMKIFTGDMPE